MAETSAQDKAELSGIGFYWSGAYSTWFEDGFYRARRKGADDSRDLTASTPQALRRAICSDYGSWLASLRSESMSL